MKFEKTLKNIPDESARMLLILAAFSLMTVFFSSACQNAAMETLTFDIPTKTVEKPAQYEVKLANLPPPYATQSVSRNSHIIAPPKDAAFSAPKGFQVNLFAEGDFKTPRWLAPAPNGDVFLTDSGADKVIILRDKDKDGRADERFTFAQNLNRPFGMAFVNGYLYVANTDSVVRFKYHDGQTQATEKPEKIIDLPASGYNNHWTRDILAAPDGKSIFVTVGSSGNVDVESDPRRAAISLYDLDGKNQRIYASGLRNPVGIAINPANQELWASVNERDGLGDDLVPDYVTSVKENAFYGFPFSYLGQNIDPRHKGESPELVKKAIVPDVLLQSHSAALGLAFYEGKMFPEEYRGDAFVALHGSWNREKLTGYKIIRVRFKDGKPVGGYEDFVTGWLPNEASRDAWGRPVGLTVASDGSLLIADDGGDRIWRVSYQK